MQSLSIVEFLVYVVTPSSATADCCRDTPLPLLATPSSAAGVLREAGVGATLQIPGGPRAGRAVPKSQLHRGDDERSQEVSQSVC